MAIYNINKDSLEKVSQTTFSEQGIKERTDLQRLLKHQIEVISEDTMVLAEEFGDWEGSNRRIDLLGLDRDANIVVIELKRTRDGGHMELQAIRYAAMLSTMTFDQAVKAHSRFMSDNDIEGSADERILGFLGWDEPDEDQFAQDVRIILASAEFSRELTTSVIWLNDHGLDIQCMRMRPYYDGEKTLLDVQQVIPLPEANDYQIRVREKQQKERQSRSSNRDFTRYRLEVGGEIQNNLAKRWLMHHVVTAAINSGKTPEDIRALIPWRKDMFISFDGELESEDFIVELMKGDKGGVYPKSKRYFCNEGELFVSDGKTYALTNQWGKGAIKAAGLIKDSVPELDMSIEAED